MRRSLRVPAIFPWLSGAMLLAGIVLAFVHSALWWLPPLILGLLVASGISFKERGCMGNAGNKLACEDSLEKIRAEIAHLHDCLEQSTDCSKNGIDTSVIARIASDFFVVTMDAISDQVQANRPTQARILIRPLVELSLSLRWASITKSGWARLMRYYWDISNKEIGHSARALGITLPADAASGQEAARDELSEFEPRPSMKACMREVWNHDVGDTERDGDTTTALADTAAYNVVYRSLCGPGHANLFSIGRVEDPDEIKTVITLECALAGGFLFRAITKALGEEQTSGVIERLIRTLGDQ
jgi:hypothetical protein